MEEQGLAQGCMTWQETKFRQGTVGRTGESSKLIKK